MIIQAQNFPFGHGFDFICATRLMEQPQTLHCGVLNAFKKRILKSLDLWTHVEHVSSLFLRSFSVVAICISYKFNSFV